MPDLVGVLREFDLCSVSSYRPRWKKGKALRWWRFHEIAKFDPRPSQVAPNG